MFFFPEPAGELPRAVGECKKHQRKYVPQQNLGNPARNGMLGQMPVFGVFKQFRLVVELRQVVVAPFSYDDSVLQQQQSGVAAYDGLQRYVVGNVEVVFRPGNVAPVRHGIFSAGSQRIERVAVVCAVFIYCVYLAEIGVAGGGT